MKHCKQLRKEFEFCIKPKSDIDFDQSFLFKIENENLNQPVYYGLSLNNLPRLNLEKPILTITAEDASRPQGQENPEFTVTYSGFVDGDDEGVLDQLPDAICSANASSVPGQYDIVPYNASDNKYAFNYVTGKLTVSAPSGIEDNSLEKSLVYPNPVRDYLIISEQVDKDAVVRISDLSGRVVLEQIIVNNSIDLQSLQKGIYIVIINDIVYKINKE